MSDTEGRVSGAAPLRDPKHEQFVQLVVSGLSAPKAYTSAGYSTKGAPQSANRLLKRADVARRFAYLQAAIAQHGIQKAAVDRARVLARLDELSREAQAKEQFTAAIRAEELLGKELGMFRDRLDVTGSVDIAAMILAGRARVQKINGGGDAE